MLYARKRGTGSAAASGREVIGRRVRRGIGYADFRTGIFIVALLAVAVQPFEQMAPTYYLGPRSASGLIFGFGAVDLPEIKPGLSALQAAIQNKFRRNGI